MSSIEERIRSTLIPLNVLSSPWDDLRYILRAPTPAEVAAAPAEELHYRNNIYDYITIYPDQGNRGTCVSWCNKLDAQVNRKWQDDIEDDLSAEDLYWKARKYDGLPDWLGEGSNNLGAMKARQKEGFCLETTYPTSSDSAIPSPGIQKPQDEYIEECTNFGIDNYYQLPLMPSVWKTSIAGLISDPQWDGPKPIVTAYKVTQTMIDYAKEHDGILPEDPGVDVLGGHSSLFAAYKPIDGALYYGNPNTWGEGIFDEGWLWWPESYFFNGILMEGWISHYGEKIIPDQTPSGCIIANAYVGLGNFGSKLLGRRSRFKATYAKKRQV